MSDALVLQETEIEKPNGIRTRSKSVSIVLERPKGLTPTHGRSYTVNNIQLSPKRIHRSSLHLSQSWSTKELEQIMLPTPEHKKNMIDDDTILVQDNKKNKNLIYDDSASNQDDDLIQLAFFPLLVTPKDQDDEFVVTSVIPNKKQQQQKEEEDISKEEEDDENEEEEQQQQEEEEPTEELVLENATAILRRVSFRTYNKQKSLESSSVSHFSSDDIWDDVPMGPSDAILGIAENFRNCTDPRKVNVAIGAYRDDNGKPWVLPSVRAAEKKLWDICENKEYLPIEGDTEYVQLAMRFAYGRDMDLDHIAAVQTLSGTGACRVGGCFLAQFWPKHPIYVPDPTWGNHITIFHDAGLDVRKYRYYNRNTNGLDLHGMLTDIDAAPEGSVILLHACAHNPTGCDPTIDEWKQIIKLISDKVHIAFFDSAYQGFASGDAEADAQPFRYAVSQRVPILLAQSFAKNFGLYGERCGTLSVVCGDNDQKQRIMSELRCIIRPMYSSPPRHGSSIVKTVLSDETLKEQYYKECQQMADRIQQMRKKLVQSLQKAGSVHDWSHITRQIGMFAFTGLTEDMCQLLTSEYAIFLTLNGRISIAGLNDSNVEYVAQAIHEVSEGKSISSA